MAEVLIVDDEVALLELLRDVVEDLDCEVLCALDGHEGWTILSETIEPPALIITDRMMPIINGLQFIELVKNMPRFAQVPIIMMSSADDGNVSPLIDAFIAKPFNLEAFSLLVEKYLNRSTEGELVNT
jgi:two-component system, sensor histidine kinase and response regulator